LGLLGLAPRAAPAETRTRRRPFLLPKVVTTLAITSVQACAILIGIDAATFAASDERPEARQVVIGNGKAGLEQLTGRVGQARAAGCSSLISLGRLVSLARRVFGGEVELLHGWLAANAISPEAAKLLAAIADNFGDCTELNYFDPGAMAILSTGGVPRAIAEAQALAARGEIITYARAQELLGRDGAKVPS
jgi:hypothetical protein